MKKNGIRERIGPYEIISAIFLALVLVVALYPFIYVISGSFSSGTDYMRGGIYLWPRKFSLDSYRNIFRDERLYYGLLNTTGRTLLGPTLHTFLCSVVAYAMAHEKLKGRKFYYWTNTIPMFFGGGLIPYYLVLKYLGLVDTFWIYILPAGYSVWNMIVLQTYFRELPREIRESAYMDGASEFTVFTRIYIPLCPTILATIWLYSAVYHWNSFFDGLFFNSNEKLILLQEFLVKLVNEAAVTQYNMAVTWLPESANNVTLDVSIRTVQYAAIVVSMIPVLLIFPYLKKFFVTGVAAGAVKA